MEMKKRVGVAVIGAGAIARVHVQACQQLGDLCEIKAVCARSVASAQKLIDECGLDAVAIADYHEAIQMPGVDAITICLPPSLHAEVSIAALNAGKHVLCEKPMAGSLEECDAMIQAAKENNKLLGIVAQNRYKTPNQKVKTLLDQGAIGPVLSSTVNSLWWRGENYYDIWWRGTWEKETGGCLANHAVHHIDLTQWMLGMPQSVMAFISNVGHSNSECEDLAMAVMQYPDKVVQLNASLVNHSEEQELVFHGRNASISVPWTVASSKAQPNGFPEKDSETEENLNRQYAALPDLKLEGHPAQIRNFLMAISGQETLLIDGKQGRNTIELLAAIYKSAYTHGSVTLPIEQDDVFYHKGGIASVMPHFHEKQKSVEGFAESKPITLGRDVGK